MVTASEDIVETYEPRNRRVTIKGYRLSTNSYGTVSDLGNMDYNKL